MSDRNDETFAAEYDALAAGCGYHSLANWSVVTLTGADRQSFLHNICTNDVRKLAVGEGCEAFCTDVKGKIVAHLFAFLLADHIVLLTVANQAERIVSHLDRYIIREDVQLADATLTQVWTVLAGDRVETVLPVQLERPWQIKSCEFGAVECLLARFPLPGRKAYLLGASREHVAELQRILHAAGGCACGDEAWTCLRVESGLPLFGVDFDSTNLPQEVSRNAQAISFTKGCYLGQETIARLDALGHVNKQLATLKFAESAQPTPGTPLTHDGQPAGTATTIAWSPRLGAPLALGMVRRGSDAIGTMLDSPCGPVEVVATAC
jgi:folate-binding protein YgfZ